MDESLNRHSVKRAYQSSMALLFCLVVPALFAEEFPDPTRPPGSLGVLQDGAKGDSEAAAGPQLQSVLISQGRRVAVISGKTVRVGDLVGGSRLIKIMENEVVLRNDKNVQTLKLFPEVEKRRVMIEPLPKSVASGHKIKGK